MSLVWFWEAWRSSTENCCMQYAIALQPGGRKILWITVISARIVGGCLYRITKCSTRGLTLVPVCSAVGEAMNWAHLNVIEATKVAVLATAGWNSAGPKIRNPVQYRTASPSQSPTARNLLSHPVAAERYKLIPANVLNLPSALLTVVALLLAFRHGQPWCLPTLVLLLQQADPRELSLYHRT